MYSKQIYLTLRSLAKDWVDVSELSALTELSETTLRMMGSEMGKDIAVKKTSGYMYNKKKALAYIESKRK